MNRDGTFSMFGPPNPNLKFQYQHVQVGPSINAPAIDALISTLSTMLSTEPGLVNGEWYRDCRPAIVDGVRLSMPLNKPQEIILLTCGVRFLMLQSDPGSLIGLHLHL